MKSSDKQSAIVESTFRKKKKKRETRKTSGSAGRPSCLDRETHENLLRAYYTYPYSFRELADMFGVSRMTVWRAVQDSPMEVNI